MPQLAVNVSPPFAVIIPAHNEASVIARCLSAIYGGAPADARPEVIVVANGCRDATVALARAAAPDANVLDLGPASKAIALNAGNDVATAWPRFFVDADVVAPYAALAATADALRGPQVMAAAPALHVDTGGCDAFVRAYYRVWITQPYVTDAMVGSGVFGLSQAGMAAIGRFPAIFADDAYVRSRFPAAQRRNIGQDATGNPVRFTVFPPRTLMAHIRIEARRRMALAELFAKFPDAAAQTNNAGSLRLALDQGASLFDVAIYMGMKIASRLLLRWKQYRRHPSFWLKDETARQ